MVTAWASATATGSDILALTFEQAVYPTQVNIHQSLAPGAIVQVDLGNSTASGTASLRAGITTEISCLSLFIVFRFHITKYRSILSKATVQ